jgi:hypothetical protein
VYTLQVNPEVSDIDLKKDTHSLLTHVQDNRDIHRTLGTLQRHYRDIAETLQRQVGTKGTDRGVSPTITLLVIVPAIYKDFMCE